MLLRLINDVTPHNFHKLIFYVNADKLIIVKGLGCTNDRTSSTKPLRKWFDPELLRKLIDWEKVHLPDMTPYQPSASESSPSPTKNIVKIEPFRVEDKDDECLISKRYFPEEEEKNEEQPSHEERSENRATMTTTLMTTKMTLSSWILHEAVTETRPKTIMESRQRDAIAAIATDTTTMWHLRETRVSHVFAGT